MLIISIDSGTGPIDYTQYVEGASIQITDSINVPTLLTLKMVNTNNLFVNPVQSGYVTIYSTKFSKYLFTGFVTNETEKVYLGKSQKVPSTNFQHMEYTLQATSDEWLLNVKSVPFIPAYMNQSMGQILRQLAEALAPGFFDTSQVQDGDIVPYFQYDPLVKWSDLAKQFGDQARYRYCASNRQIVFAPYGDSQLGIVYDESMKDSKFVPTALQTQVLTVPPVNDAIVTGAVEPQTMWDDYFIGNGFDTNFQLRHKVFNGSTNLLLQDDWTENTFSSNWTKQDPQGIFTLVGGLNAFGPTAAVGSQYILANNGIELGGHLSLQHGLFTFTDVNSGLVGAVFSGAPYVSGNCLAGFQLVVAQGDTLAPSPSGATNLTIQAVVNGATVPILKTLINHQYLLSTQIDSQRYTRYNQIYRGLDEVLGNTLLPCKADITFRIADYDMGQPWAPPVVWSDSWTTVTLPSFGQYLLLDLGQPNLAVNYTLLSQPPQAKLHVAGLFGPTGAQLPPLPYPVALGLDMAYPMGFGMSLATATIQPQGDQDSLVFYSGYVPYTNDIPGVGAHIGLTSWESGLSLARVQNPQAIAKQAVITGDDGVRTAVFHDLKPTPRTSEEAELAASAQIIDRSFVQYDGSYTVYDYFWDGAASDYPCTGRYLPVNSPSRNIFSQNFFARQVTTKVIEMFQETLTFEIQFGQDLFLEKLLRRFIATPASTFEPNDTAIQPTLQVLNNVGLTFLPDLIGATASTITGTSVTFDLGSIPVTGCEVRSADSGWGTSNTNTLIGKFTASTFVLPRTARDQTWYMRNVNGTKTSRFTRAMRIQYPLVPTAPIVSAVDQSDPRNPVIQLGYSGDIQNIRGIEIRDFDNVTVLKRSTVISPADLNYTYNNQFALTTIVLYAYFFNLQWEYSPLAQILVNIGNPIDSFVEVGPNLLGNPGFEANSFNLPVAYQFLVPVGQTSYLSDSWLAAGAAIPVYFYELDNHPHSGGLNGMMQLGQQALLTNATTYGGKIQTPWPLNPTLGFPVVGGEYYSFGGYAHWEAGAGLPAGVTGTVHFEAQFFDTDGNLISTILSSELTAATTFSGAASYVLLKGMALVPSNAAFIMFQCFVSITNASGAGFATGSTFYQTARFDDCFLFRIIPEDLVGLTAGSNLIGNPGFQTNEWGFTAAFVSPSSAITWIADGWQFSGAGNTDSYWQALRETGVPGANTRTGQADALISLLPSQSIANGVTTVGALYYPTSDTTALQVKRSLPVRGGDYYYFGGYARFDWTAAFPAGVSGSAYFRLNFYDTNGNLVGQQTTNTLAQTGVPGVYAFLSNTVIAPQNAAYMILLCVAGVTNSSGGTFNTGLNLYEDVRFDDVFLFKAERSAHSSYKPASNPLTAHDTGASATVNIAPFAMTAGTTIAIVNSGAITTLSYSTLYYIYYDDSSFSGGAVTYHATTVKGTTLLGESRYFVGSILTPKAGTADTIGNGDGGAGSQTGIVTMVGFANPPLLDTDYAGAPGTFPSPNPVLQGTGVVTNPNFAVDNDTSTAAVVTVVATGAGGNFADYYLICNVPIVQRFGSVELHIIYDCTTNTFNTAATGNGQILIYTAHNAGSLFGTVSINAGQIVPRTELVLNWPSASNLGLAMILIQVADTGGVTTGTMNLKIYEAWFQCDA